MYDLKGVIELIAAYPVHIMTFVGCILLFGLVLPRRRKQHKQLPISTESTSDEKKELTQDEKEFLTGRIRDSGIANLKKSFVGKANPVYTTLITISFVVLFFLWIIFMLPKL